MNGYWTLVLHSHLPFVKHPEFDYFLEEHWFYEALTESYIPLLLNFEKLLEDKINFKITISLTPPLCEMFTDNFLMERFFKYLNRNIELCQKEIKRTSNQPEFNSLAHFYLERYIKIKNYTFDNLQGNIINGYKKFIQSKNIEVITCAATHGFLPFLGVNSKNSSAQIKIAVDSYKKHFSEQPKGIWLPECAYYNGLSKILADNGIKYFFIDTHGIIFGSPRPQYGIYAPIYTEDGVAAFGRDHNSSKQVWSSKEGYPGDYNYRDFYRDIGYDLDFDYIHPYIIPDGTRVFTGIKYYKITGNTDQKEPYNPNNAYLRTEDHAKHFIYEREKQFETIGTLIDRPPLIVSPYDAELFGHWWFEGPDFIYNIFKYMDGNPHIIPITPSEYLSQYNRNQVISLNPSSWGDKGFYEVWLNASNDWVYRHILVCSDKMIEVAKDYKDESDSIKNRLINQLARELLLVQSSDWTFLMTTKTALEYATKRVKEHIHNFNRLLSMLNNDSIDTDYLSKLEFKNSLFSNFDLKKYFL